MDPRCSGCSQPAKACACMISTTPFDIPLHSGDMTQTFDKCTPIAIIVNDANRCPTKYYTVANKDGATGDPALSPDFGGLMTPQKMLCEIIACACAADEDTSGTWDGTSITFPDGTVYTPAPDTAGTWNGTNITFPDGSVYTPVGDSFGTFDGTMFVFPDGTTYTPESDTNTFGTWDGTSITFPDGTEFTPPPPTVDTSGTWDGTSITFPDGSVYTPAIGDIQRNCAGVIEQDQTNVTKQDHIDSELGFVIPYVPAGLVDDPCRPETPVDCPAEFYLQTVDDEGSIWEWNGNAWNIISIKGSSTVYGGGIGLIGEVTPTAVGLNYTSDIPEIVVTNNTCHPKWYQFQFSFSDATFAISAGNQWTVQYESNIGSGYSGSNNTVSNLSGEMMNTLAGDYITFAGHTAFQRFVLQPGQSTTVSARVRVSASQFVDDPNNRISMTRGSGIGIRGFCHTRIT